MGEKEQQIKANDGKLDLSVEKCVHKDHLAVQEWICMPINLPVNLFISTVNGLEQVQLRQWSIRWSLFSNHIRLESCRS